MRLPREPNGTTGQHWQNLMTPSITRWRTGSPEPWLKLLLWTSIVLPLLILAVVAWHDYDESTARAAERVERTTRIAREHALKVVETNDIMLGRVLALIGKDDDHALLAREADLHRTLDELAHAVPQVQSIWIWGAAGRPLATSTAYAVPGGLAIADQDHFRAVQTDTAGVVISDTFRDRYTEEPVFVMARRRDDAQGRFAGAVTIAVSPTYFTAFFEQLAGGTPGMTVALTHPDATLVTRFPDAPAPGVRDTSHNPLIPLITNSQPTAVTAALSPQDSRRRYVMAQRVGDYPLFVSTGLLQSAVLGEWLQKLWLPALVAFGAGFALVLATLMTLNRTRRERAAVAQWQEEATRRASAERMLSKLSQHLIRLSETEKAKLAAELHDELGGALSAIALDLAWVLERLKSKAPELVERQSQAYKLVQETAAMKRRIIDGLRPMLLQHLGLSAALRDYVGQWSRKTGIPVDMEVPQEIAGLAPDAALALFRIVQESLTNVAKYANARHVGVSVVANATGVTATVADDGTGIAPDTLARSTSHGLMGMQQRIAAFAGSFEIDSKPGQGTRITAHIPCAQPNAAKATEISATADA